MGGKWTAVPDHHGALIIALICCLHLLKVTLERFTPKKGILYRRQNVFLRFLDKI